MTVSQYKATLSAYPGNIQTPADFEAFWKQQMDPGGVSVCAEALSFCSETAVYETLTISHSGGTVKARSIRPAGNGPFPLILMFHNWTRGIRGWHHMTRFIALGYAVIALEAEPFLADWKQFPEQAQLFHRYQDALILAGAARTLSYVDAGKIVTWGEGFGGGLAVAAAAMLPERAGCMALNPMPADIRSVCTQADDSLQSRLDYTDTASFAAFVRGPALIGVCLMDEIAKPEGQYAIFNRLSCPKTLKVYPKYGHERVNAFENEILSFLHREYP